MVCETEVMNIMREYSDEGLSEFNVGSSTNTMVAPPLGFVGKRLKSAVSTCKTCMPYNGILLLLSLSLSLFISEMGLPCKRGTHAGLWDPLFWLVPLWTYRFLSIYGGSNFLTFIPIPLLYSLQYANIGFKFKLNSLGSFFFPSLHNIIWYYK